MLKIGETMKKSLKDKPFVILDTETTGLDPSKHEILEICMFKPKCGSTYKAKIKPEFLEFADPKALEVNGYNEEEWADAISIDEALLDISNFINEHIVVGHNVQFDLNMLKYSINRSKYKDLVRIPYHCIDTVTLAQEHLVPMGLESVSLDSIRGFLGINKEGSHRALKDVMDTAEIFKTLYRMSKRDKFVLRCKNLIRTITLKD